MLVDVLKVAEMMTVTFVLVSVVIFTLVYYSTTLAMTDVHELLPCRQQ